MKFNKNFIGYEKPNSSRLIDGIIYHYNEFGHRCKKADKLNFENYILFAGCSHTEGEGLHVEHTYPYITSKKLNTDYYNLSVRASGFDVLFFNVMTWLALYPLPKLIVIQYPDPTRFSIPVPESPLIEPIGPWTENEENVNFYVKATDLGLFSLRNYCNNILLNTYIKIPLVKLIFGSTKSYDSDAVRIDKLDYAVDNLHYGSDTHDLCSDIVIENYNAKINTTK